MIMLDEQILQHFIENWEKQIALWVQENKDNLTARRVIAQRKVGEDVGIDVVQEYDRTGEGAKIVAKGTIPGISGLSATSKSHTLYQICDGIVINDKDIKMDPKTKSRSLDIAVRNVHRTEDLFCMEGDSNLGVVGISGAAQSNPNGKIVSSGATGQDTNNAGAWSGEVGTDIYDDLLRAVSTHLDGNFTSAKKMLVGRQKDVMNLYRLDSERQPYYKLCSSLFPGSRPDNPDTWIWKTENMSTATNNKVYVVSNHPEAGEYVISENPHVIPYPLQPGQNWYFEISSWSVPEMHQYGAFVEIDVS